MKTTKKIIQINEELCNGCGLCANTCHQVAIKVIDGKAKLLKEDMCDGFGRCLKKCPQNAISFIQKEVEDVTLTQDKNTISNDFTCPSTRSLSIKKKPDNSNKLINWPIQIKLVPTQADYYNNADLLIAADCTAFAYTNIKEDFMNGKVVLIGCSKLDSIEYSDKLSEIFISNNIRSITLLKMEVPCCGGLQYAVTNAVEKSSKDIPIEIKTISISGKII